MKAEKLDKFMDDMTKRGIPGCDLAISVDGEEIYRRPVGFADLAQTRPIGRDTLYWIYSTTKILTCTAAMRLIEEGKMQLSDPVSRYLPTFAHLNVREADGSLRPAKEPMRLLHLFTMTGGLDYNANTPPILAARAKPQADTVRICEAMAQEPLGFDPGTHYRYSLCHDVLAAVVEVVSGMRFSAYLHQIMLDPLGMSHTGFHPTKEERAQIAQAYTYNNATGRAQPLDGEGGFPLSPLYESGGGGLYSSADDYMRLLTALALGGTSPDGYRLLKRETVAQMEVNRLSETAWTDFVGGRLYGYGWGLCGRVHVDPIRSLSRSSVGEFGWDGAHAAFCMVDRAKKTALYFAAQVSGCAYAYTVLHPILRNLAIELAEENEKRGT